MTVSPSRRAVSCIATASAPSGNGAPVKMRAASPDPSRPSNGLPAADSPTTVSRAGAHAASAARNA